MRRGVAGIAILGLLLSLALSHARIAHSDCGSSAASAAQTSAASGAAAGSCPAAAAPQQTIYQQLATRLGGDLAQALTTQEKLNAALDQTAVSELVVTDQITQEEAIIADLEDKVAQLDVQIQDTQDRIDVERAQIAAMARAAYRQPRSLLQIIARAGSLRDALVSTYDLVVAGDRAHTLQSRLEADLLKLQSDRDARLADLDRENGVRDQLVASINALNDLMANQDDLSVQLGDLVTQIQDAVGQLEDQPADVTVALAALLEQQESDLIAKSYQAAWNQAQVGAGLALATRMLPPGTNLSPLVLSWPMTGARVTQPFGPSTLLLEPSLGPFPHFHTGIDLAAALGTPVLAAADGIVVAVAHTSVGYGNYVMIAHGGGVITLYAHLLETDVGLGDRVARGKKIGLEGSSGLSTGPHVHFEVRINDQVVDPTRFLTPATPP
ncbi:MAG TPA: peptidoglycan DD-metalloendopeptidase family protein [Candidatus Dormibacteraeota bacterium]